MSTAFVSVVRGDAPVQNKLADAQPTSIARDDASSARQANQGRVYNSIEQFSSKVEIYAGSVSTVFKALDSASNLPVVVKIYHRDKMAPKHYYKLQREIRAMISMNGPYVAELYSTFEDKKNIYLIMELCEGGDLFKAMLKHGGRLDEHHTCVEIILPLLRVLEKMHSLHLMHRDIKPENIFLSQRGTMRLGDFGLAMNWDQEIPFSRSGTLDYMAPEVLLNPATQLQESPEVNYATLEAKKIKPFTSAVDVWAAGILAYELVCGRPPFEVEDEAKTVSRIIYDDNISFPSASASSFSHLWADFIRCTLVKDPLRRPDAKSLISHPWIQSNLSKAISHAPTPRHRQVKEELLKPLSLAARPLRIPSVPAPPSAPFAPSGNPVKAMMTPQAPRPPISHHHDQHSKAMRSLGEQLGGLSFVTAMKPPPPAAAAPAAAATGGDRKSNDLSPLKQQLISSLSEPPMTAVPTRTQASPVPGSKEASADPTTPTKTYSHKPQVPSIPPPHPGTAAKPLTSAFNLSAATAAVQQAMQRSKSSSDSGRDSVGGHDGPDQTLPPSGLSNTVMKTPSKAPYAVPLSLASLSRQKSSNGGETGAQYSNMIMNSPMGPHCPATPGPAGPGIKERLKFHLSRQAH